MLMPNKLVYFIQILLLSEMHIRSDIFTFSAYKLCLCFRQTKCIHLCLEILKNTWMLVIHSASESASGPFSEGPVLLKKLVLQIECIRPEKSIQSE